MPLNPEIQKNIDVINASCQKQYGPAWCSFIEIPFIIGTFKGHASDRPAAENAGGSLHTSPQQYSPPRGSYAVRHRVECNDEHIDQQSLSELHRSVNRMHLEALKELAADPALADEKVYTLQGDRMVPEALSSLVRRPDYKDVQLTFTPYIDDMTREYYCEDVDNKILFFLLSPSSKLMSALGKHLTPYEGVRAQDLIAEQEPQARRWPFPR